MITAIAALVIIANVTHIIKVYNLLMVYSPIISLLLPIRAIIKISGTAAIPLKTEVQTNALIGFMPIKLIKDPIRVEDIITP